MTSAGPIEISVVIATRDRRERLRRCLGALAAQTLDPGRFEVVVADDGSADGTAAMVEALDTPLRVRALRLAPGGWAQAANAGARAALAGLCLHLDDDVLASPRLVEEHLAAHRAAPRPLVAIGRLIQPPPRSRDWFVRAHAAAWNERYERLARGGAAWPDCYGANFSAPRELLVEAGGFRPDRPRVADMELAYRLSRAGCTATYLPAAAAVHEDEKDRAALLRATSGYGSFCAEFAARNPETRATLLGWFGDSTPRETLLRRALIAVRLGPAPLAAAGAAIPGAARRRVWHGFVSRYAVWLAARRGMSRRCWRETIRSVPVLMYHALSLREEHDRFVLPARTFARQMRLLALLGLRPVSLDALARSLREGGPLPRRAVVVTVDDGYRDSWELARPVLARRRVPATLFACSGRLGAANDWDEAGATAGRPLVSAEQLRLLREQGIEVGAHSRTHPILTGLADERLSDEVGGSRRELERAVGAPVTAFAYPYGALDERVRAAVAAAGFLAACTTDPHRAGLGADPLAIPRIEIRSTDGPLRFVRKLWLGGS